ncbi:hypothetical protein BD408DRAFT_117180 [Parasitella parasitica]|nr:hypothetical protein BD408DRAFT_117180 [Parasitella parasitica]
MQIIIVNVFHTSNQRAKETKSRKFTKLRQDTKPEVVQKWEERLSKHSASTVDVTKFSEYLKARSMAHESLSSYYRNEDKAQRDQNALPFRKMKHSSTINRKQSDSRLAKTLRSKFGEDPVLVIGD